ncbi:hypothetical protein [Rhodopseudomonas sp. RCAM05734]|uniref:hypothetical protein n=1 Tax=Rhodopseudomonas sp. RCAM05734 TaxID=3457549 RepID=UPI004044DB41
MRNFAKRAAIVLLPLALACCGGMERGISFTDDQGTAAQPVPKNARADLLSFFRTYINNPVGVRDAALAEPVQRTVGGRLRYVGCVRYTARDMDGKYQAPQERGVMFVDGRLDRVIENSSDACAGATFQPFPELQAMTR